MGFLGRLFGTEDQPARRGAHAIPPPSADAGALDRYRYMVKTAPPETLEQAHEEAFAKLTPEQRRQLLEQLVTAAPPNERAAIEATSSSDPRAMARVATRAEIRQPGTMERMLGGTGMGFGASLLSSFAAGFVGSMVAQSFFSAFDGSGDQHGDTNMDDNDVTAANDESGHGDDADFGGDDGGFDGGDFDV
jgi:hypothetical protein